MLEDGRETCQLMTQGVTRQRAAEVVFNEARIEEILCVCTLLVTSIAYGLEISSTRSRVEDGIRLRLQKDSINISDTNSSTRSLATSYSCHLLRQWSFSWLGSHVRSVYVARLDSRLHVSSYRVTFRLKCNRRDKANTHDQRSPNSSTLCDSDILEHRGKPTTTR